MYVNGLEFRAQGVSARVALCEAVKQCDFRIQALETFRPLWKLIRGWKCFLYVTRTRMRSSRLLAQHPSGAKSPLETMGQ